MSRASAIPTNHLTIYLIKDQFQDVRDIVESSQDPQRIDDTSQFFFEESHTSRPRWLTSFFGGTEVSDLPIFNSSSKGILITQIQVSGQAVRFAVAFGMGRHFLKDGVIEEGFGLKVVLNSADLNSFRSIDKTTLGSVPKQSREQMSREVSPTEFGIDIEQDLISSVTAVSNDTRLGKVITGKDALSVSVKVDHANINDFLSHCYQKYVSTTYRRNFDWIDQIMEVRDSILGHVLSQKLVDNLNNRQIAQTWMAVPEIINWAEISGFRFHSPKRATLENDLDIETFISSFSAPLVISDLKFSNVYAVSAQNDETIHKWSAFKCIYTEIDHAGKKYILNNGKWYEIALSFVDEINNHFTSIPDSTLNLLSYSQGDSEAVYNQSAHQALSGSACMDQQTISHGGGHSSIEFCDILTVDKKLVHIKKYGGSSVLSHLFNQGVVSAELFVADEGFRTKLNRKLPPAHRLSNTRVRPVPSDYEIVYAIIDDKPTGLEIPFFSKVSLRNAKRRLTALGYAVSKKKIDYI